MKKKLLYLLLALTMCASLTACGGGDNTASTTSSSGGDTTPTAPSSTEDSTDGPTDAQLSALTEAYNQVATLYNGVATMAQENGWTDDQETVDALQTISAMMEPVGEALSGDMSALDGADFDALPDALLELVPDLEVLSEKVSVLYEGSEGMAADGGSEGVTTDEDMQLLTETFNQVATFYNDVAVTAQENGWTDDQETVDALQTINAIMEPVGEALNGDMSALDGVDLNDLSDALLELVPDLEALSEKVSVPY